jgi:predicted Rossmann fold nucleotide-binding protein DprA/Smf involved in DNA uptake
VSRTDTAFAALLLTQRLVDTPAKPLTASEYWALLDSVPDPSELLGLDAVAVAHFPGMSPESAERVTRLFDAATAVAFAIDEHEQGGVRALTSFDEGYPAGLRDRLGRSAPPVLYAGGDASLLSTDLLGIVGSRDIDPAGADAAKQAAKSAVGHGLGVVSGGAKGVDRLAMDAALDAGGHVVGVLADSLVRSTRDPEVRRAVADGRVCLCTPFKPSSGFTVGQAMGRNKVIYAVAKATLVAAADLEEGGTWAGAAEAIKQRIAPVAVWMADGKGRGNDRLVTLGGTPVARVDALFPLPKWPAPADVDGQLALDV